MSLLKAALGAAVSAAVSDAVVKPRQLGRIARAHADRVGRPLLLIHGNGIVHHTVGAPVRADVSTSRAYPLPYPAGRFGAILAVGILETLKRPDVALQEWRRVADKVFVVVPAWWSPQAWLSPSNRWFIDSSLRRAWPTWNWRNRVYLLPLSDNRYAAPSWQQRTTTTSRSAPRTVNSGPLRQSSDSDPHPSTQVSPSFLEPSPATAPSLPAEVSYSDLHEPPPQESQPFDSSNFASTLMVVSSELYDES